MPVIILCVFRFVRLLFSGHQAVAVENVALRLQLAAFKRKRKRPVLTQWDRLFWVGISRLRSGWRDALLFVQPETVVRWQRERFRRFWARLSQSKRGRQGRPAIAAEIRRLILRMAAANPLWRAPRIHGELKMLGIAISERTVSRILRTIHSHPPSQTWQTFLRNHLAQIVSVDFFTVPTIRLRVLFVFLCWSIAAGKFSTSMWPIAHRAWLDCVTRNGVARLRYWFCPAQQAQAFFKRESHKLIKPILGAPAAR